MAIVIALSGAHNTGKTTVLNALAAAGFVVDTFQASRKAQTDMGLPLEDIIKDPARVQIFQDAILRSKIYNDSRLVHQDINKNSSVFVDRSPADMYAYTSLWVEDAFLKGIATNDMRDWFQDYMRRCVHAMAHYDLIFQFPIREEIPFAAESQRATKQTQLSHAALVDNFLTGNCRYRHTLHSLTVEDRVEEIDVVMKSFIVHRNSQQ